MRKLLAAGGRRVRKEAITKDLLKTAQVAANAGINLLSVAAALLIEAGDNPADQNELQRIAREADDKHGYEIVEALCGLIRRNTGSGRNDDETVH